MSSNRMVGHLYQKATRQLLGFRVPAVCFRSEIHATAHSAYLIGKLRGEGSGSQHGDYISHLLKPDFLKISWADRISGNPQTNCII